MTPATAPPKTETQRHTYRAKVIVVGDGAVGKTSIIVRYVKGEFDPTYIKTIGVNFFSQDILVSDRLFNLQIWDTAGQEHFGPVRKKYFLGARGAILVYDKTDQRSFENIDSWLKQIEETCGTIPTVLVGNKADLTEVITLDQGQKLAKKLSFPFIETSAKTGLNTVKVFSALASLMAKRYT
jgi:Ras-related protein Rab-8A